jgi:hypothetical protein
MVMFRAEKTTQNKDDFRVLMAGILFVILMTTLKPYALVYLNTDLPAMCSAINHEGF